jgi:hypothetical protein
MEPQYEIRLIPGPDGQLLWKLACSPQRSAVTPSQRLSEELTDKKFSQFIRRVIYDDGRARRIIYEVDTEADRFRYILERSNPDEPRAGMQRLVFGTLQQAVFCLVGCINRNE